MRLWSVHPRYLDTKGLVAAWREALLAQKVLQGLTKGYTKHPQLKRFRTHPQPLKAISYFLLQIYMEATSRGFKFDKSKIQYKVTRITKIPVQLGQVQYEFELLVKKLKNRSHKDYLRIKDEEQIELHPIFKLIPGDIEDFEVVKDL